MTNRRAVDIRGVISRPESNEIRTVNWSPRPDSNRGPFPYQGNALPPELRGRGCRFQILSAHRRPSGALGELHSARATIPMPLTLDELLERARRHLVRVEPQQAAIELGQGALLVDIRPVEQRDEGGCIPGATVINRNVLEWRLAPESPWRIPAVTGCD